VNDPGAIPERLKGDRIFTKMFGAIDSASSQRQIENLHDLPQSWLLMRGLA
jgi:hypothetical protein